VGFLFGYIDIGITLRYLKVSNRVLLKILSSLNGLDLKKQKNTEMIVCGYTQLENAKTKRRLCFYFIKNKGFAKINAVGNGLGS